MFADDVIVLLTSISGYGVYGTNVFKSSKASVPSGNGPYTSVISTGGPDSEKIHNRVQGYPRPTAQITVRAMDPDVAEAKALVAFNALNAVKNQTINTVWYLRMQCMQSEPFDGGLDELKRQMYKFNVIGWKKA